MYLRNLLLTLIVLLIAVPLSADTVKPVTVGNGAAFWNAVTPTAIGGQTGLSGAAQINQPPKAYWDHGSFDSNNPNSQCNIGWALKNQLSGCNLVNGSLSDDPAPNAYWSLQNGNYDPGFYFNNGSVHADTTELELRITGYQGMDIFGWYETNAAGTLLGATHELFNPSSTVEGLGPVIPVVAGANFGFYLTNGNGATFYTNSAFNTADADIQHFGVFRVEPTSNNLNPGNVNRFYIGVEDLQGSAGGGSDFDYNDFVVEVNQVPEPASILLFGTLLAGCSVAVRRRRRS